MMILRRFGASCLKYRFSRQVQQPQTEEEAQLMQRVKNLPFSRAFRRAQQFRMNKQYQQSNQQLEQALKKIENKNDTSTGHYVYILKNMIMNYAQMNKPKNIEQTYYRIIQIRQKKELNPILIYDDYHCLMQHYLNFDVPRAALLGKALLTENERKEMSVSQERGFQFQLGNAYALMDNFADAKKRYITCLQGRPLPKLKARVLNNFGVVCWWHKNAPFSHVKMPISSHSPIDSDYSQSAELIAASIALSEELESNPIRQNQLKQVLSLQTYDPNIELTSESSLAAYNMAQFLLHNKPQNKPCLLFWFKLAHSAAIKAVAEERAHELLSTLYLLLNETTLLFNHAQKMYTHFQNSALGLQLLKVLNFKQQNSRTQEIQSLEKALKEDDPYFYKRKHLYLELPPS